MEIFDSIKKNPTSWGYSVQLDTLYKVLIKASESYYNSENILLEDDEFDQLVEIYNKRSPKPYSNIGAKIDNNKDKKSKCHLPYHMGSMNKTKSIVELLKWIKKRNSIKSFSEVTITPKVDGTSALIVFQRINNLSKELEVMIYTRGDGDIGKRIDFLEQSIVSNQIKSHVNEYMTKMNLKKFVCRGEMIVSKTSFEKYSTIFKCPRSMVNGLTNKKDNINMSILSNIDFALFEVIEPKLSPSNQFILAKELGFNVVDWKKLGITELTNNLVNKDDRDVHNTLTGTILNWYRENYIYDIDGIIISIEDIYQLPKDGNPDYSIAFKINQKGELTKIKRVEWNVSKHGLLKPKLIFDSIKLGSSNVERCTGYNGAYIFNNLLGPGAIIRVVLSGEIIPFVTEIITPAPVPSMPSCGYKWNENKVDCLILEEDDNLIKKRIITFIKAIEVDYLADGLVNHLYSNGFKSIKSILLITREQLLKLDRIEEKMADKLIESIINRINNELELERIMDGSLCFGNGFGIKRCQQIMKHVPTFLEVNPDTNELMSLPGWSGKSIEKFLNGLPNFREFLSEHSFLKFKNPTSKESIQHIKTSNNTNININIGLSKVCITGKRDKTIIDFLNKNNVEIIGSITKDTDLLICFDKNGNSSKLLGAKAKGIEINTIDEFKARYNLN